ncbi:hypothetical protein ANANG_G00320340, partial [Anguilla anguilla]
MEVVMGAELSPVGQEGEELRTQQQIQPRSSPAAQRKRRIFRRVRQVRGGGAENPTADPAQELPSSPEE